MKNDLEYIININQNIRIVGDFYDNSSSKGIILLSGYTEHRTSLSDLAKKLNKDFKVWTFDPVRTVKLSYHQLAVAEYGNIFSAKLSGSFQGFYHAGVLGDIIGGSV